MRVGTRLLILKLVLAAAALGVVLAAMHFVLPALLGRRGPRTPGEANFFAETKAVRVTVPRSGSAFPTGPSLALQLAGQTDAFLQSLRTELGPALALPPTAQRLVVNVLPNHAEAEAFAREHKLTVDVAHPSAFYGPESWTIVVTLRPYPELLGLVLHMAMHLLMERAGGSQAQWSPWLFAGMAVAAEQGALGQFLPNPGPITRRDAAVVLSLASRSAHVPLHMLVRGGRELFTGPLGSLAYREAGLFVVFLLRSTPTRRAAFLPYLTAERQPGPVEPGALEAALGTTLAQLEKEWFAFLQSIAR